MDRFSKKKNPQIWNFTKIRPVEAELFHASGRKGGGTDGRDRHDEDNSRFSQFCERA